MAKKLILAIISFVLIFSDTVNILADNGKQNDYQLLEDLEIYDDSFSDLDKEISRARFAVLISRLIGNEYSSVGDMTFEDVSKESEEYGDIFNLYNKNLISHSKNYRPEDTVSSSEAVKILVSALGYGIMAESRGGYPAGYQSIGIEIGLYKGVNSNLLTVSDALNMIDNSLDAEVFDFYKAEEAVDISVVEIYRNIKYKKTIITENSETSLEDFLGQSSLGDNMIKADGEIFIDSNNKAEGMLGLEVKIWYNKDTMEVLSITPAKEYAYKKIVPIEIDSVEDAYTIICDKENSNKRETIKLDKDNVKVIFNGSYTPLYSEADLDIKNGYIEMYDSNNDKYFDIVYIWSPKVYVVDKSTKEYIYFKYGETFQGNSYLKKTENMDIYLDGAPAEPSDLVEWDILNVYEMKNSERVRVESEFKRISGMLTGKSNEYIDIDGDRYEINPLGRFEPSSFELGKYIDVYLDITDRVYLGVKVADSGLVAGYITKIYYDDSEERAYIEVFDSEGEFTKHRVAEKIKVFNNKNPGGYTIRESEQVEPYLLSTTEDGTCYQLVKYSLNKEDEINSIYCAIPSEEIKEGDDYPLKLEYDVSNNSNDPNATEAEKSMNSRQRRAYAGVLYFRYRVEWGPKFWLIPANPEDRDFYQVKLAQNVGISRDGYTFDSIKLYNCDINGEPELALSVSSEILDEYPGSKAATGVVTKVTTEEIDEETATCFTVLSEGSTKKIYATEEFTTEWSAESKFYGGMKIGDIKSGDVIQFEVDYKNEIKLIRVMVRQKDRGSYRLQYLDSASVGKLLDTPTTASHVVYGKVVKKYSGPRVVVEVKDSTGKTVTHEYVFIWKDNYVANYYLIEGGNKVSVEQGSVNDIGVGDEIAFRWTYSGIDDVFIYKAE